MEDDGVKRVDKLLGCTTNDDGERTYYIKFRNSSYRASEWLTEQEVLELPQGKNWLKKCQALPVHEKDHEFFDSNFAMVDRCAGGDS